jgi:hypothetical protein
LPSWCRERVHFRETLLYLARLAFNLPVVSIVFRTFRLVCSQRLASHLTRCLLLRA